VIDRRIVKSIIKIPMKSKFWLLVFISISIRAEAATNVITGALSGYIASTNTWIVTNTTTTGGTVYNYGVLRFNQNNSLSLGTLTNSSYGFFGPTITTNQYDIEGLGSVQQSGSGTTTLTYKLRYTGSTIVNAGTLIFGNGGTNDAFFSTARERSTNLIINGGTLVNKNGYIGDYPASVGVATVNGGTWSNSQFLTVGSYGKGTLSINGGTVSSLYASVGKNSSNASGSVSVSTNGNWISSTLDIGGLGSGSMTLNGGSVKTDWTSFGASPGGVGKGVLNAGTWETSQSASVGAYGNGSLDINGGTLQSGYGSIGYGVNARGVVNVSSNGVWTSGSTIMVGMYGQGTLNLNGNGLISIENGAGSVSLAYGAGSTGTLNLGNGGSSGTLNAKYIWGGSGTATVNVNASNTTILNQDINGSITLKQIGSGTTIMTGSNYYTGGTIISRGTLKLGSDDRLADTGNVTISGGTLDLGGYSDTVGLVTLNSGSITNGTLTGSSYSLQSGTVSAVLAGSGSLTKSGAGTVTLSGQNSYTGGTIISRGTLKLGSDDRLADSGDVTVSGGTLDLGGYSDTLGLVTLNSGSITNGTLTGSSYSLQSGTVSAVLAGSGSLTKSGAGTVTLSGQNSYTGGTIVNAGLLATLGENRIATNRSLTVNSGGTFQLGGNQTISSLSGDGSVALGSSTLTTGSEDSVFSGNLSGLGGLTKEGAGTFTLSGNNTFLGNTTLAGGALILDSSNSLAHDSVINMQAGTTLTVNQRTFIGALFRNGETVDGPGSLVSTLSVTASGALNSVIADDPEFAAGILKYTDGTTTIGAANTFTGSVKVQGGTLQLGSSGSFDAASSLVLSAGAIFDLNNKQQSFSALNGTGGTVNIGAGTLVANVTGYSEFAGGLTGSGAFVKDGAGTQTLSGDNTQGSTLISAGTLQVGNGGSSGSVGSGDIVNNGTLVYNRTDSIVVSNAISGSGSFVKDGAGDLNLTGSNSYTGLTQVLTGTLAINGSIASGLTVDAGATLKGSGVISGNTDISGTHSPGNSPGIQTFGGNLTYSSGAGILLQFTDNTTNNSTVIHDQIMVGKDLIFSGLTTLNIAFGDAGSAVDWNNAFWQSNQNWTLYSVSGITTGFENLTLNSANWSDANGLYFDDATGLYFSDFQMRGNFSLGLGQNGRDVVLNYSVPEPSTYALIGLGALALVIAYRRKRA
jgi:autotransporter-associated beta strand protein/T5SS/PEP-CTERM-associated repeat protein